MLARVSSNRPYLNSDILTYDICKYFCFLLWEENIGYGIESAIIKIQCPDKLILFGPIFDLNLFADTTIVHSFLA